MPLDYPMSKLEGENPMRAEKWSTGWKFWEEKDAFALVWSAPGNARDVILPRDAMRLRAPNPDSPNVGDTA